MSFICAWFLQYSYSFEECDQIGSVDLLIDICYFFKGAFNCFLYVFGQILLHVIPQFDELAWVCL